MNGPLDAILAFPTVLFTIPLGVTLCYWLTVMVGAVGVDLLDGDFSGGLDGADGAIEGGAKAAGATMDGVAGGVKAASGALESGVKAASGALEGGHKITAGLLFGGVPITVSFSTVVFFSWVLSLLLSGPAHRLLDGGVPSWLTSSTTGLLSLVVGTVAGALAVRPLRPLFTVHQAPRRSSLLGRVCVVASGRVEAHFGQATFEDGGAGLILNIVCGKPNTLKRGERALILNYDPVRDVYEVEPVDWLLPEELQNLNDPEAAAALARAKARVR